MKLWESPRTMLGMVGATLAVVSGVVIVGLGVAGLAGFGGSPYVGIVAYMVLPAFFVAGLLLIPLGAYLARRRLAHGEPGRVLPILDFNDPVTRRRAVLIAALTAVNVLILGFASYEGVHVMDSPRFCGSCHSVMEPEFTAYQRSPHARVECVNCHIGPGAPWFVKAKLSGAWQVISVTLGLYDRPIPTPVEALRPARDTCEGCHWPAKFQGDRLAVRPHFAEDQASSETKTVLLVHVGGSEGDVGPPRGIHAHVAPGVTIRYAADKRREHVSHVESIKPDGSRTLFTAKDAGAPPPPEGWRTMDCVDCHNRASHRYRPAAAEVDQAIVSGRLDRSLPFVKREVVKALTAPWTSREEARTGMERQLLEAYRAMDPGAFPGREVAVRAAAAEAGRIYDWNVWPSMRIGWGTYASLLGHDEAPGCWRCHDDAHLSAQGKAISQDCSLCHAILAQDEADPAVLKALK